MVRGALPVRWLEPWHRYWQAQIGPRQSPTGTLARMIRFATGNFQVSTDVNAAGVLQRSFDGRTPDPPRHCAKSPAFERVKRSARLEARRSADELYYLLQPAGPVLARDLVDAAIGAAKQPRWTSRRPRQRPIAAGASDGYAAAGMARQAFLPRAWPNFGDHECTIALVDN